MRPSNALRVLALLASGVLGDTSPNNTGDQLQKFLFSFTSAVPVIPVVSSCPTPLWVSALTSLPAGGPDPQSPYTMVVLAHEQLTNGSGSVTQRTYAHSVVLNDMTYANTVNVPWWNGTQFIACVWANNGVSGGCQVCPRSERRGELTLQDLQTVVQSDQTDTAFANSTSQCLANGTLGSWVTPYTNTLAVSMDGVSGTVSDNAWPTVCMFRPPFENLVLTNRHRPPLHSQQRHPAIHSAYRSRRSSARQYHQQPRSEYHELHDPSDPRASFHGRRV